MKIPQFQSKEEELDFIVKNQSKLIAFKKATFKKADTISAYPIATTKAIQNNPVKQAEEAVKVQVVINCTNFLDSHGDVHIKGCFNKTLNENKNLVHLQEHCMEFEKIISDGDDLTAYAKNYTFKQLGYDFEGTAECLIFESTIKEERNKFMYEQYSKGYVKSHSIGMNYVKMYLCVNSPQNVQEFENWNKYYPEIANKERADEKGYFWAVTELKLIEGSAVVIGSNTITPTLNNNMKAVEETLSKNEPNDEFTQKLNELINKF